MRIHSPDMDQEEAECLSDILMYMFKDKRAREQDMENSADLDGNTHFSKKKEFELRRKNTTHFPSPTF